jgi:hypothetical protein
MKRTALIAAALVLGTVGALAALGTLPQQSGGQLRMPGVMPRGALVYLESRDLAAQMKAWVASPTRKKYYASASYRSFTRSKLYLKLHERLTDLQQGFGFEITEERLAAIAGGPSAVAVYDPGKLEILFVTEVPRERAAVTQILAAASGQFRERTTPKGVRYLTREMTTDGGSLTQQIALAHADGRFFVSTSEAILAEALDGAAAGGLATDVGETAKAVGDFAPHDVSIWLDFDKVARNKYFGLYWIHRNKANLGDIASGFVDVEFAADGIHERRWFALRTGANAGTGTEAKALAALRDLAPQDAQFVEARTADPALGAAVAETVFGPERHGEALAKVSTSDDSNWEDSSDGDSDRQVSGRYEYLDRRFEKDLDDPSVAPPAPASRVADTSKTAAGAAQGLPEKLAGALAAASPIRYAVFGSVDMPQGQRFASFRRGVVVELAGPEKFDPSAFEGLVSAEFGRRFVVGGTSPAAWGEANGARALAGALVAQGGAYRLSGNYLVIAQTAEDCAAVVARVGKSAASAPATLPGVVSRTAQVRIAAGRTPFTQLTRVLDTGTAASLNQEVSDEGDDGEGANKRPVLFFSENVASLLDVVSYLSRVEIVTAVDGAVMRERVDYLWG